MLGLISIFLVLLIVFLISLTALQMRKIKDALPVSFKQSQLELQQLRDLKQEIQELCSQMDTAFQHWQHDYQVALNELQHSRKQAQDLQQDIEKLFQMRAQMMPDSAQSFSATQMHLGTQHD